MSECCMIKDVTQVKPIHESKREGKASVMPGITRLFYPGIPGPYTTKIIYELKSSVRYR